MRKIISSFKQWHLIPLHERREWYIPESITTAMLVRDNNEPLVDVINDANIPLMFAVQGKKMKLRRSVVDHLHVAAQEIVRATDGKATIRVYDAFRPLSVQREQFEKIKSDIAKQEGLSGRELWERVTQFIADPDLCPPHATGGAIDCTIADSTTGDEYDMGTPINTIHDHAYTYHDAISPVAKKNRAILYEVMTKAGFVNLATEWWHYSYGDQYWAVFLEKEHALYGAIE